MSIANMKDLEETLGVYENVKRYIEIFNNSI